MLCKYAVLSIRSNLFNVIAIWFLCFYIFWKCLLCSIWLVFSSILMVFELFISLWCLLSQFVVVWIYLASFFMLACLVIGFFVHCLLHFCLIDLLFCMQLYCFYHVFFRVFCLGIDLWLGIIVIGKTHLGDWIMVGLLA